MTKPTDEETTPDPRDERGDDGRSPSDRAPRGRRRPPFDVPSEAGGSRHLLVAGVVTLVVVVIAAAVVLPGSAAHSSFDTSADPIPSYSPSVAEPVALKHEFDTPSTETGAPLVTRGELVTTDEDGTLVGRAAGTGQETWRYSHPGTSCGSAFFADSVVTVHHGAAGCSDVTALDPTRQIYTATRQGAADDALTLHTSGQHVLALGSERLEIWRTDLVRTVEYGRVDAPQEPGMQPRSGCALHSAGLDDTDFAVAERCPGETSERLTVSRTSPEDSRKPEERGSDVTGADRMRVLAVGHGAVLAAQEAAGRWTVERYTVAAANRLEHRTVMELPRAPEDVTDPAAVSADDAQVRWFDGRDTHAFSAGDGRHLWSLQNTTGPGAAVGYGAGAAPLGTYPWTTVPVDNGIAVVASGDGAPRRTIAAELPHAGSAVPLAQVGDILYARIDGVVHAFKINPTR